MIFFYPNTNRNLTEKNHLSALEDTNLVEKFRHIVSKYGVKFEDDDREVVVIISHGEDTTNLHATGKEWRAFIGVG